MNYELPYKHRFSSYIFSSNPVFMSCNDFNTKREVNDDITRHVFTIKPTMLTVLQYKYRRTVPCTDRRATTNPLAAALKRIASPHVC